MNYYVITSAVTFNEWFEGTSIRFHCTAAHVMWPYWLGMSVHDISWKRLYWIFFFFFRFSFGTSCRLCWRGCVYYCWLLSCYIISIIIISIIRKTMITLHSYFLTRKSAVSELYVVDKSCHIGEQNKNSMTIVCEAQRWQVRDRSAGYPTHPVRRLEGGSERQQCHFSLWTLILSIELLLREPNTHPQPTS